jgi:acyl carrier protein
MSQEKLLRIQSIFREIFDQPALQISEETSAAEIPEWDSVAMVQIVLAIEQEFGLRLSTAQVAEIKSAGDLLRAVA